MKCVECLKQMHSEIRQGVTLDVCPSCFGTWFDYDEINNYLEAHPENRVATQDRDAESLFVRSVEETQDVCPKCRQQTIERGIVQGIGFRRCAHFCGFFMSNEDFNRLAEFRLPAQTNDSFLRSVGTASGRTAGEAIGEGIFLGFWYLVLSILTPG